MECPIPRLGEDKNEISSSPTSNDEPSVESKGVNIGNLIDFDVDPQPPDAGEGPSAQSSSTPTDQLSTQCAIPSINGDCLASFDFITHSATLASRASLSSLPLRSISSPALASLSETVSSAPFTDQDQPFVQPRDLENANTVGSISSLSTSANAQPPKQFAPSIEGTHHSRELQTVSTAKSCPAPSRLAEHTSAEVETQLSSAEAKLSGRKELPEDLFTASYSSASGPVLGWQTGALHNMPFGAQYNPQSLLLNIPHSPSLANPFDRSHVETFSSYGSLQGALPNMAARQGMLRTSSLGNLSSQYITQYSAAQSPAFSSVAPSTTDMHVVQQVPCNFSASGSQRFSGYGGQGAAFISSNSDPEQCRGSSHPSTPNSFTRAGNPFS